MTITSISIGEWSLCNLQFADNIDLMAETALELQFSSTNQIIQAT